MFIMIEDINKGRMSVTNNIKNIVEGIFKKDCIPGAKYKVIYKDSDGIWDGWDHKKQDFISIRESHWLKAALKMIGK